MTSPTSYTLNTAQVHQTIRALNARIENLETEIRQITGRSKTTACSIQRLCYRQIELIEAETLRNILMGYAPYEPAVDADTWRKIAAGVDERAQAEDDERCARAEAREVARHESYYN